MPKRHCHYAYPFILYNYLTIQTLSRQLYQKTSLLLMIFTDMTDMTE